MSLLSLLKKKNGPTFEQTWSPFTQGCFVPNLVEIFFSGSGEEDEKVKNHSKTKDKRQSENLTWAFNLGELKSYIYIYIYIRKCNF